LKNFPTDDQIQWALSGQARQLVIKRLTYYWMASYTLPQQAG